jgi:hypothetical protein
MEKLFEYHFEMLDNVLETKYNGKLTEEFLQLVESTKEELKYPAKFSKQKDEMCEMIDWCFVDYLGRKMNSGG